MIDYAVGTTGAFALSAALYQTLRTGKGQYIDMAMIDVALILQASHITDYFHNGHTTKRAGNRMRFPESSMQEASDGLRPARGVEPPPAPALLQRDRRGRRKPSARSLDERYARYEEKQSMIARKMKEKTAQEWEDYLQSKHVPATRVRELKETLQDPHLKHRGVLHRHENVPGVGKAGDGAAAGVQVRARRARSSARRRGSASTPTRSSRPSATARTRSRRCASPAPSHSAGYLTGLLHSREAFGAGSLRCVSAQARC